MRKKVSENRLSLPKDQYASRNSDFVTEGDDPPDWFSSLWIAYQWIVMDALFDLELSYRFGRIGSLVDVGRHLAIYCV
jgi:hypothetical protein